VSPAFLNMQALDLSIIKLFLADENYSEFDYSFFPFLFFFFFLKPHLI